MNYIETKFKLAEDEYRNYRLAHIYGKWLYRILLIAAAGWLVYFFISVKSIFANFSIDFGTGVFLLQAIIFIYITALVPLTVYLRAKKMKDIAPAMKNEFTYLITKEAIVRRDGDKVTQVAWEEVGLAEEYKAVYVLTFEKTISIVLPKRAFDREQTEKLIEIMKEKLPEKKLKLKSVDKRFR